MNKSFSNDETQDIWDQIQHDLQNLDFGWKNFARDFSQQHDEYLKHSIFKSFAKDVSSKFGEVHKLISVEKVSWYEIAESLLYLATGLHNRPLPKGRDADLFTYARLNSNSHGEILMTGISKS